MKVELLSSTDEPLKLSYIAAKTCYSALEPAQIKDKIENNEISSDKIIKLLKKVYASGHHSVFEHISFSFAISGISRACSHQLVRHRLVSFSQQSQRYVKFSAKDFKYIIPNEIKQNTKSLEHFKKRIEKSFEAYNELLSNSITKEDARFIIPNAAATNIVMTLNFRELNTICSLRLCNRAQWEIHLLFKKIRNIVNEKFSFLGNLLQPKCESLGYCPEFESCGRLQRKEEKNVK